MKLYLFIHLIFLFIACGHSPQPTGLPDLKQPVPQPSGNSLGNPSPVTDTLIPETPAQKHLRFAGNWDLQEGWFPEKDLIFEKSNNTSAVFVFEKNGTLAYPRSKQRIKCSVGVLTMKDGTWTVDGQYLTLELRGLKMADYWYWWKVQYKIKTITPQKMELKVVKVLKNRKISPSLSWEDLVNEAPGKGK